MHLGKWMPALEQVTVQDFVQSGNIGSFFGQFGKSHTWSSADIHLAKCMEWALVQVISLTEQLPLI